MNFRRRDLCSCSALATIACFGQDTPTAPAPDAPQSASQAGAPAAASASAPAPPPSPWTKHGVDFHLLGDVYADLNFNHPDSGVNGLCNGAARYQLTKRFAFAPRAGMFNDRQGFATGTAQTIKEVTVTREMKIRDGLLSRLEFRRDNSDKPFFDRGANVGTASPGRRLLSHLA